MVAIGRLRVFSGKERCRYQTQHGFNKSDSAASHVVMQKRTATSTVTVPPNARRNPHRNASIGHFGNLGWRGRFFEYE
jgi:predicted RNA binding protein YcfA (HicA-like mRNA interferase family)